MGKLKDAVLKDMEKALELVQIRKRAIRLAAALMPILQVNPYGVDVIHWLGEGRFTTNREVLIIWIIVQLQDEEVQFEMSQQSQESVLVTLFGRTLFRSAAANDAGVSA